MRSVSAMMIRVRTMGRTIEETIGFASEEL
jgi:hypothetical protein